VTSRGFTILPVLFDPPAFRSSRPAVGAARGVYPRRSNREFGRFAATLVRRYYGPNASFWRNHPSLPRRPLRAWQIWNEPHIKAYWPTGRKLKLKGLIYYNWRDIPRHAPDFQDYIGPHVGLLDLDGHPKPAYGSFVRTVHALE